MVYLASIVVKTLAWLSMKRHEDFWVHVHCSGLKLSTFLNLAVLPCYKCTKTFAIVILVFLAAIGSQFEQIIVKTLVCLLVKWHQDSTLHCLDKNWSTFVGLAVFEEKICFYCTNMYTIVILELLAAIVSQFEGEQIVKTQAFCLQWNDTKTLHFWGIVHCSGQKWIQLFWTHFMFFIANGCLP